MGDARAVHAQPGLQVAAVHQDEVLRAERAWTGIDALLTQQGSTHSPAEIACLRSVSALDQVQPLA